MDVTSVAFYFVIAILLFLALEDWRYRSVSLWSLLLYLLCGIIANFKTISYFSIVFNELFVAVQFILLITVFSIKYKRFYWRIDELIGWGDIVFICFSALCLQEILFVLSYMLGLIVSLLFAIFFKNKTDTIPLISGLALVQAVCIICWRILDFTLWF